jgi:hypothetical protein
MRSVASDRVHNVRAKTDRLIWRRAALTGAVAAVMTAAAVPASATTTGLTIDTPCVRENEPVKFHLAGFTPDAPATLYDNGSYLSDVTVGGSGDFQGQFPPGGLGDTFYAKHAVTVADAAGNSGAGTYEVVRLGVVSKPVSTKPSAKVSYYAQGFVEGGTLYAHYVFSKSETVKKLLKTVPLGKLSGACGTITTKKVTQLPIKKAKKGLYEIQFDTSPAYKRQQGVYVESTVFVTKNQTR